METPERTAGIRRRDAVTLDEVIREALPRLLGAARAAGLSAADAEDISHSCILVLLERAESFDGRARASTWLLGVLANKLRERQRKVQREEPADDIDQVYEARFDASGSWQQPPHGPLGLLAREDARRMLGKCLEGLPERQRQVLLLREVDEVDAETLCKILGVTSNNLGVLLFRARVRMRECLESSGIRGSVDAQV